LEIRNTGAAFLQLSLSGMAEPFRTEGGKPRHTTGAKDIDQACILEGLFRTLTRALAFGVQ
jgi:hypothetical protein